MVGIALVIFVGAPAVFVLRRRLRHWRVERHLAKIKLHADRQQATNDGACVFRRNPGTCSD